MILLGVVVAFVCVAAMFACIIVDAILLAAMFLICALLGVLCVFYFERDKHETY